MCANQQACPGAPPLRLCPRAPPLGRFPPGASLPGDRALAPETPQTPTSLQNQRVRTFKEKEGGARTRLKTAKDPQGRSEGCARKCPHGPEKPAAQDSSAAPEPLLLKVSESRGPRNTRLCLLSYLCAIAALRSLSKGLGGGGAAAGKVAVLKPTQTSPGTALTRLASGHPGGRETPLWRTPAIVMH